MTPEELKVAGEALYGTRWQTALARRLRTEARSIRRYLDGTRHIPGPVEAAIELLLKHRADA